MSIHPMARKPSVTAPRILVLEWEGNRRSFTDPLVAADVLTHRMMWRAELRYRAKTGRYNLELTPRQRAAYSRTKARVLKILNRMMRSEEK